MKQERLLDTTLLNIETEETGFMNIKQLIENNKNVKARTVKFYLLFINKCTSMCI